jgi:SAM-dependent methyltransferase
VSTPPVIHWTENGQAYSAHWRSENGAPPGRIVTIDDRTTADEAYGLACQGTALLWRGDFQNARQMLIAVAHRADRQSRKPRRAPAAPTTVSAEGFHRYRQARAQRARTLAMLLVLLDGEYRVALPRAPDIREACLEAYGPSPGATLVSLRAVLGLIGAHEWRIKGIEIPALGGRIHPHYGVFAPIRSEYVDLVSSTPLPALTSARSVAFDIGTGTGVLAAVLARRGIRRVVATDLEPRALQCARQNIERLGLTDQVQVEQADLFPAGLAALVVCNPPWLPARPTAALEQAIYDPESGMLRGFLNALPAHLEPDGEGWLILSDLAEHLGLRSRDELLAAFEAARLTVLGRHDVRPRHPKARDNTDPLHEARAAEVTSLWRLAGR